MSTYLAYEPINAPGTLVDISEYVTNVEWDPQSRWMYITVIVNPEPMAIINKLKENARPRVGHRMVFGAVGNSLGAECRTADFAVRDEKALHGSLPMRRVSLYAMDGVVTRGTFGPAGEFVPAP